MHSAALQEMGLSGEWSYEAIEVSSEDFETRVRAMEGEDFVGANVTVPHKIAALALADEPSPGAAEIGAANTLSFAEGRILAENTDATGFLDALPEPPAGKEALVLGAGGSARAVVWALVGAGASASVWNRTPERGQALAAELGARALGASPRDWGLAMEDFDLIVNCTTVGMGGASERPASFKSLPIDADSLSVKHQLVDLAYGSAETELASVAAARGASVIDGLEVLVRQGAASLRIWTGMEPPIETMRRAARAA
jgi:shikimate dehydrogenase